MERRAEYKGEKKKKKKKKKKATCTAVENGPVMDVYREREKYHFITCIIINSYSFILIIKMASFGSLPVFIGDRYGNWRRMMKTFLKSQGLWKIVLTGKTISISSQQKSSRLSEEEYQKLKEKVEREDNMALFHIQQSLSPTIFSNYIIKETSAKNAWDILANNFQTTLEENMESFIIDVPENKPSRLPTKPTEEHKPYYWAIRKVPEELRELNEAAYTPRMVSIGPLHHGKPELAHMETTKQGYLEEFLTRAAKNRDELTAFIRKRESDIRRWYSEPCQLESDPYVEMILLDSTFIFEKFIEAHITGENDLISYRPLDEDLMLFENQLPFKVFNKLFTFALPEWPNQKAYKFIDLCLEHFGRRIISRGVEDFHNTSFIDHAYYGFHNDSAVTVVDTCYNDGINVLHFTDLILRVIVGVIPADRETAVPRSRSKKLLHTAKKLSKSGGVQFQPIPYQDGNPSLCNEITFSDGSLTLQELVVDDSTEGLFRNLMVSEQVSREPNKTWLCSYILLLSFLIKTREDVKFLAEKDVIRNELQEVGTYQEVADMINKLCTNIKFSHFHYSEICRDLNRTCYSLSPSFISWWNGCVTRLKDVYFGDLWRGTATISAVFLLLLTLIQSITSILQVTSLGNK